MTFHFQFLASSCKIYQNFQITKQLDKFPRKLAKLKHQIGGGPTRPILSHGLLAGLLYPMTCKVPSALHAVSDYKKR